MLWESVGKPCLHVLEFASDDKFTDCTKPFQQTHRGVEEMIWN